MLSDSEFRVLLDYLNRSWRGYRKVRKGVIKRLRKHLASLNCTSIEAYITIIDECPAQRRICEAYLNITISRFYRDRRLWDHLSSNILPDLARINPFGIHAWSAGCACGEEAYSLVAAGYSAKSPPPITVTATDHNETCLNRARTGTYQASSLRDLSSSEISRWFDRMGDDRTYVIKNHLRHPITWLQRDLFGPPPAGPFHLIFLRNNLLTYHSPDIVKDAFSAIIAVLEPGGWLIIGSHETLPEHQFKLKQDPTLPYLFQRI